MIKLKICYFFKKFFLLIFIIFFFANYSCKSSKNRYQKKHTSVTEVSIFNKKDTLSVNQLRFYKIQSAMDCMKMMYENYGIWNKKISTVENYMLRRIIWHNIKLIDNNNELFTVIATGYESKELYYAGLIVFDSKEKDSFEENHPLKNKLIEVLITKMKRRNKTDSSVYKLFK
ncbi:hypothetical protein [Polaribacter aquimarinus]|uniref:Uncharacterized protein n=1 Tax=Polaribacter aquimarinus TaxID=2100726 RepID=A0A2U2JAS9_9FLAO|nr:hypothetical protein [Polaribacter aquimarinus]PWG05446.1 hypothetical protein DIS07_09465 [Polaribacter aquimarinus]